MLGRLYAHRFEIFFLTQTLILFGSLIIPPYIFQEYASALFFLFNLLAGALLIFRQKKLFWFFVVLLFLATIIFASSIVNHEANPVFGYLRLVIFFLFYLTICYQLVIQVWKAKTVDKGVMTGLLSGYLSLGLVGFFLFLSIETVNPGSFSNIMTTAGDSDTVTENLVYFSYITMLTIGYGDMAPLTPLAKKATVLLGLLGQFYLVIITGIILSKYMNQTSKTSNSDDK